MTTAGRARLSVLLGFALLAVTTREAAAQQRKAGSRATLPDTAALLTQCAAGAGVACESAAWLFLAGGPVGVDTARAVDLIAASCNAGRARACGQSAWMLREGKGVRPDTARAFTLFRTGCAGADAKSCTSLGYMYESGIGVVRD
ncbi:MAG TPA: hypothetical protein VE861_04220, partial [Gemmatimonadaceae bacterium]|nr:hypothetical protein [Gemmatimonadaceae bacterium]